MVGRILAQRVHAFATACLLSVAYGNRKQLCHCENARWLEKIWPSSYRIQKTGAVQMSLIKTKELCQCADISRNREELWREQNERVMDSSIHSFTIGIGAGK
jgi:hypothetical protein